MSNPLTLRDARRIAAAARNADYNQHWYWRHEVKVYYESNGLLHLNQGRESMLCRIDRLTTTHGAHTLLRDLIQLEGKKSNVKNKESEPPPAPSVGEHAGDGEASEDAAAVGLAPAESSQQGAAQQAKAESGAASGEVTAATAASDSVSDAPPGRASVASDTESAAVPNHGAIPVSETGHDVSLTADDSESTDLVDSESEHGSSNLSGGAGPSNGYNGFGGANFDRGRKTEPRIVRRLASALKRLLRLDAGLFGEDSPRYDGRRLIREIASRRLQLSRARRLECEAELAIFAVDVSGSCSSFSAELWSAAEAVARHCGGVARELGDPLSLPSDCPFLAIQHSNGCVRDDDYAPRLVDAVATAIRGRRLATVIALGDDDGSTDYAAIAAAAQRFFYMHNWLASAGPQLASRAKLRATCGTWPVLPTALIVGVSTAETVLEAIYLAQENAR